MSDRLKELLGEIVESLEEDAKSRGGQVIPLQFVKEEAARWKSAREDDAGIWFTIVLMMLRFGFKRFPYRYEMKDLVLEKLGDLDALAEMEDKDKRVLAQDEILGLNLQQIRSVAKNARTAKMLLNDFGSLIDLVASFEGVAADLSEGMEEMFSYLTPEATKEFARQMGLVKPGSDPAVRRVLSRMDDLVDGSLDLEGIQRAIQGMAESTEHSEEEVDSLLRIFASGEDQIGVSAICDVKSSCFRCRLSKEQCSERRFEFGSSLEISRADSY
ncbi:MAG: hypothetical protein QF492_05850 [Candidatus Krumholzibacteria bacterium]|jgi:hypothetical protein|nr:hypothetical protein [Candidatus Krumholzibacteria bacterium]MDP6798018.1 hypothetical protein [Candidatus Krumholzibacteria bacterium]MDP7021535.1 hypothetical protein [Candidatus Krumholzibacteria bacterium]